MKQISLKYRIALTMFALMGVMLSLLLWQVQRMQDEAVTAEQAADEGVLMEVLGELSRFSLIKSEYSDLGHYFSIIRQSQHVEKIIVADAAGHIVMSTDAGLLGLALPVLQDSETAYWRARQLANAAGAQGLLAVEFSNADLLAARKRGRTWIALVSLISMTAIAVVSVIMGGALTRRLAVLSRASKRIGEGDFKTLIDLPGSDEVSELGRTVVAMARKIETVMEDLKASERRFASAFEHAPIGLALVGLDERFLQVNQSLCDILGYPREKLLAMTVPDVTHPDDRVAEEARKEESRSGGKAAFQMVKRYLHSDGHVVWGQLSVSVVTDNHGRPQYFIGQMEDITERRRAEEALRESEEKYKQLVETTDTGYVIIDSHGRVVDANREYVRLTGHIGLEEILGRAVVEWTAAHDLDRNAAEVNKCVEQGFVRNLEIDYVGTDGRITPVEINATILRTPGSVKILTLCRDITERRRTEEKIRNLNRVYAVLSNINQAIIRIREPRQMFQEACRIAVEDGGFRMAWIGLLDGQAGDVTPTAIAGLDDGYVENLMITLNNESRGRGPTGSAVREGRHSVCNDIEHDERMAPWREDALRRGYRSSAAFPLVASGKVRGSFSLYAGAPDFFNESELKLLDELALDISYALEFAEQESRRSRAESDLRAAEAKYRTLVEQIPAITYVASPGPDSSTLYISPQVESILGFTSDEWKADPGLWLRQIHPEDRERVLRDLDSSKATDTTFRCEYRLHARNGRVVWVRDEAVLLRDDGGSPQALQGVMYDITERRRAEEERQKLISLVETSTDMIGIATLDGEVTYLNNARRDLVGVDSLEEAQRTRISDYIVPEDMKRFLEEIVPAVQKTGKWTGEIRYRHWKTGKAVPVELTGFMIYDRDTGRPLAMASICRDISERKRTEAALRHSEEQYRLVVENANDAIFIAQDGLLKFPNAALVKLLGHAREEIESQPFSKFIHPDDREMVLDRHTKRLRGHDVPPVYEFRVTTRSEAVRWVELSVVMIAWEGRPATLNFLRDITHQKKLEQQFLHAQKMEAVGQLAGGIAHDFNNILTAIIGYGNVALMKLPEDEPVRPSIEQILAAADRAAGLTRGLLTFSRKQIINPQPVSVNAIIRRVRNLLQRVIGEDIALLMTLSDQEPAVLADSGQIEQVLMNLAANARDAMPRGGRFTIETGSAEIDEQFIRRHGYGKKGAYALVAVSDTGEGMNEATRQRVFEPFFTTKEVGKGTGLGLAMVYGCVKQHNGYINVTSEPGKGASFQIYLPVIPAAAEPLPASAPPRAPQKGNETILLAEDDETVRNLLRSVLEDSGYTVIEARDGQEAVEKVARHGGTVDLLIIDVVMPGKNGKEVFEQARRMKPGVKVLFMSGYPADVMHRKEIFEFGMPFISKPAAPDDLLRKIREVLNHRQSG